MPAARRLINIACLFGLLLALALRYFAAGYRLLGHTGARWSLLLSIAVLAVKLLAMVEVAAFRRIPWPRLLLPAVVLAELLRVAAGTASRKQAGIAVALLEAALLAMAVVFFFARKEQLQAAAYPEDVLERIFALFVPDKLARFMANELFLYWSGARWCLRGFRLQPPQGFAYLGESLIAYLPVVLPLLVLLESAAYEMLMHGHPLLRICLLLLDAVAILWSFGMYATIRMRPHQAGPELVRLHCGLLGRCEFQPQLLLDAQVHASDFVPGREVARLRLKNTPTLQLQLSRPVQVRKLFGSDKSFGSVLISADDPAGFRDALLALREQGRSATLAG